MKFRTFITILLAGSAMISACSKVDTPPVLEEDTPSETTPAEPELYELSVGMDNLGIIPTKGESDISTPYIIIFEDGQMIDYKNAANASFFLRKGNYRVYATVGIADISNLLTEKKLKEHVVDLAGEEDMNFTMIGYKDISVPETLQAGITVMRGVSKVIVRDVYLDFRNAGLQGKTLNINDSWICNAAKDIMLGDLMAGVNAPKAYYNNAYWHAELKPILYSGHIGQNMTNKQTYDINKSFYTFPNTTGTKKTRLILECYIDGKVCYYPVVLDELKPNYIYTVSKITITKKGIDNPDGPWEEDIDASASITIEPWGNGGSQDAER